MCLIVSMHFSGSNRATRLYESCSGEKKAEHQGRVRKHDEVEKTTDRGGVKELFSIQMHGAVTVVYAHMHALCGILLISYSFFLFAPRSSRSSLLVNARRKMFMILPGRCHYNAAYVNTIAKKRRKNERGHEGEYPVDANEGERSSDVVFGRKSRGRK